MTSPFLAALKGENQGRPPLWLMRQAGRCLPEYRALRAKYDFMTLCHTPELIREVTLQPIKRFNFDAAILFSDILMIPDAMGLGLRFEESKGPIFAKKIETTQDVEDLRAGPPLEFVAEGIKLIKQELDRPLVGFAGAPFTTASYMIEGGSSRTLQRTLNWMEKEPQTFHRLLEKIASATTDYLKLQIEAGVSAIQLFDSWSSFLSPAHFDEFSLRYLKIIKAALPPNFPVIFFSKGRQDYEKISSAVPSVALSVDSSQCLPSLRKKLGAHIPLQGNLNPETLLGTKEGVLQETLRLLDSMKQGEKQDPAWIFNLGHGVLPTTPLENLYTLRDTVFNH